MIQYFALFVILSHAVIQSHQVPITILTENDLSHFSSIDIPISHTGTDACVTKVTDGSKLYILKQINNPSFDEQFLLINDCIASTIGYQEGIPVNQVVFIPYTVGHHLKIYPERAATLHQYIPGEDLEQRCPNFLPTNFTLQQRVINPHSPWQKKWPLDVHEQGFTQTIVESIWFNEAFALITALDTFVGNSDRSLPNILYDESCNCFCGIDQAAAFVRELPLHACQRLKELRDQGYFYACSPNIIGSLCLYRDTLIQLKQNITPDMIIQAMKQLISYLGVNAQEHIEIRERIAYHSSVIEGNYQKVTTLIMLLDEIVQ